jgi:glycosyltransferase involved in cell wall biosynthesis
MKIIIDGRFYGLEHAGLGRYTMNVIRELSKIDKKNKYILLLRKKHFNRLNLPDNWEQVVFDIPHYTIREQLLLPKVVKKHNPDLFHALHINVPILYRGKFVVTIHDLIQVSYESKATTLAKPAYLIKSLAIKVAVSFAVKKSTAIIAPSKAVKENILERCKAEEEKISVVYEGVENPSGSADQKRIKNKFGIRNDYLFYVGNAYPHKNIEFLIKAVNKYNLKRKTKIDLIIAGSRDVFKERLGRFVKSVSADKFVKILGYVKDDELVGLYSGSIAFVYPSTVEGFGLQGLEAMRNSTIVLASDIAVFREIYREHAIYFDPRSENSLVAAIDKVIKIPRREKDEKASLALSYSEKFTWRRTAEETLDIYENSFGL